MLFQNKYKDLNIQKEIATLLPCFAQANTEVFCKKYLKQTMEYLFDKTDKLGLLQTIGQLAESVGAAEIDPYFQDIIQFLLKAINQP